MPHCAGFEEFSKGEEISESYGMNGNLSDQEWLFLPDICSQLTMIWHDAGCARRTAGTNGPSDIASSLKPEAQAATSTSFRSVVH